MIHKLLKNIIIALLTAMLIISQTACTPQIPQGEGVYELSYADDWLLNTYCYIQIPERDKEDLIRQAFAFAREYENKLSRTVADSEIAQFNASAGGCVISGETGELLEDCLAAYELSGGMLDVTVGAVTSLWDFSAEEPQVPDAAAIEDALQYVGSWDRIRISPMDGDEQGRWEAVKYEAGILFDLGAVARGYIADRTADFLRRSGVKRAVINFGGNVVFVGGKGEDSRWACGIEDPSAGQSEDLIQDRSTVGTVRCEEGPVVTSGTYERCFEQDGKVYHHVLDPRTGYPVETDLLSASVIGPSSEICDILSTACLLLGSEKGMDLIETQEGYEAVFILQDRTILTSSGAVFTAN